VSTTSENAARTFEHGRLVWFGEPADERFWFEHWAAIMSSSDGTLELADDELGRMLLAAIDPESRVLEAGCGSGTYVAALRESGRRVEGIEYSPELVELVNQRRPDLPVRVGDALAVDAADGAFDAYVSIGVIEHRREGPEPFLAEAHRVLRPGGVAVIAVPTVGRLRGLKARLGRYRDIARDTPFFQYGFRPSELAGLVEAAGFEVVQRRYYGLARMLDEELPGFGRLPMMRGGTRLRKLVRRLFDGRDGHMVALVAERR
jgi:SAM-dependent methyltransferase